MHCPAAAHFIALRLMPPTLNVASATFTRIGAKRCRLRVVYCCCISPGSPCVNGCDHEGDSCWPFCVDLELSTLVALVRTLLVYSVVTSQV
jgi:hypothetical protein